MALTCLYSDLSLIYEFSTESQKMSQAGYAVSSLEVCLESMLQDPVLEDSNEMPDDSSFLKL